LAVMGFGGYWEVKILIADGYWRKAVLAASKNDGTATYNLEIKSIGINPNMADYRAIYSQTSLALAKNFLTKENMTDEDKQSGTTLVQQAVREAKAAVSLDQKNADYWSNLANIYKSLVGMVDGAADWSVQAYQQAIIFDPVDPLVKLDLGGLYYGMGDFESADRIFEQVVSNKNDYANGWYNWAYSAKNLNKLEMAVSRLDQALKLVPADSADYEKASQELTVWKKELDELNAKNKAAATPQTTTPETLKTAQPLPTGNEKKVVIPTGGEMAPVTEVTVIVSPTVTPGQ
jgi:tetratricopeptide (TPR) repeat protein